MIELIPPNGPLTLSDIIAANRQCATSAAKMLVTEFTFFPERYPDRVWVQSELCPGVWKCDTSDHAPLPPRTSTEAKIESIELNQYNYLEL